MEGLIYLHNRFHSIGWLNSVAKFFTLIGDMGFFWLVLAFVLVFFKKTRKAAIVMTISLAFGYVFNDLILKNIFMRDRPFVVNEEFKQFLLNLGLELPDGNSFPSGHAFSSFLCATILTLFHKKLGFLTFPIAFLIALSRIYLCVHYPTDVLAGLVVGVLFAICFYLLYRFIERKFKSKKRQEIRKDNVSS